MKQNVSKNVIMVMLIAVFSVSMFFTGCNSADQQDPDARIPKVPPGDRSGGGGGPPSAAK